MEGSESLHGAVGALGTQVKASAEVVVEEGAMRVLEVQGVVAMVAKVHLGVEVVDREALCARAQALMQGAGGC